MRGVHVSVTAHRLRLAPRAWLTVARVACVVVAVLAATLCLLAIPLRYDELAHPAPAVLAALDALGISPRTYALYSVGLDTAFVAVFFAVGGVIFRRRSQEPMALLVAFMLVAWGPLNGLVVETPDALNRAYAALDPLIVIGIAGYLCWVLFFYLFPSGLFVPGWTRWAAIAWLFTAITWEMSFGVPSWPEPLFGVAILGLWGSFVVSQTYRYRAVSTPIERQQTKWVVVGVAVAVVGFLGTAVTVGAPIDMPPDEVSRRMLGQALGQGFMVLIPLSLGAAVLRYRLWDIDPIVNRTLVYGGLSVAVVGIYVVVVGYLGTLFRTGGNLVISLIATGMVAVLFQPLRQRLQRGVNRLMYGDRDDPYAALSRFGRRLEATLAPDTVLPKIVQTVKEALRLPYAAITLTAGRGSDATVTAAAGAPVVTTLRLPLLYQHEPVGELVLAPRTIGEPFSPADRRLLEDLARQAGVAVRAVQLTAELQRSRERLVTAREEERRRLRRDLHDGLGPALAGMTLQTEAVRDLYATDPARADALLTDLTAQLQAATTDIRRLVYALRPPALDELGLVGALRAQADRHDLGQTPISVVAPGALPPLPAAVEVAAYRIAQEAVTNVLRHAGARICTVSLVWDGARALLTLEVADDGRGLPPDMRAGVGITSMQERAEELGGRCLVEALPNGGTMVRAILPCSQFDAVERP